MRAGAADLVREFFVGGAEVVEQLLVRGRLLQGVELLAVQVLDQRVPEQVVILRLLDDGAGYRSARRAARRATCVRP